MSQIRLFYCVVSPSKQSRTKTVPRRGHRGRHPDATHSGTVHLHPHERFLKLFTVQVVTRVSHDYYVCDSVCLTRSDQKKTMQNIRR